MLYAYDPPSDNLAEHLANVGFVIRSYEAKLGNVTVTCPTINLMRTYNGGKSQMAFELGLPYDPQSTTVPAGSTFTATVEYLVPPSDKAAYYGNSDYLTDLAAGGRFNRKIFGLSFDLKTGLRFSFHSVTCLKSKQPIFEHFLSVWNLKQKLE